MSNDPRLAAQEIGKEIDRLGRDMSHEDWMVFLCQIESDCEIKQYAAEVDQQKK
jgi:hypothetical protein